MKIIDSIVYYHNGNRGCCDRSQFLYKKIEQEVYTACKLWMRENRKAKTHQSNTLETVLMRGMLKSRFNGSYMDIIEKYD